MINYDAVLRGGRVIDPESGLDAVRDVAIAGDRVAAVGTGLPPGRQEADVAGQVVTAGFIDLHSHAHDLGSARLQVTDGVTTALELEAGVTPVAAAYAAAAAAGRPVNYGFAASWAMARMDVLAGLTFDGSIGPMFANLGEPAVGPRRLPARDRPRSSGCLQPIWPTGRWGSACWSGTRPARRPRSTCASPRSPPPAGRRPSPTRATSSSSPRTGHRRRRGDRPRRRRDRRPHALLPRQQHHACGTPTGCSALVERAQRAGAQVSTEAYPYGAGMTGIGAAFLAPERLAERGLTPRSLIYAPTGEEVADAARLSELRATDPGGLAIIRQLDEDDPGDQAVLLRYLTFPGSVIASDAMP